jgi:hypothetical protein
VRAEACGVGAGRRAFMAGVARGESREEKTDGDAGGGPGWVPLCWEVGG